MPTGKDIEQPRQNGNEISYTAPIEPHEIPKKLRAGMDDVVRGVVAPTRKPTFLREWRTGRTSSPEPVRNIILDRIYSVSEYRAHEA
jgi:hypothetical protein